MIKGNDVRAGPKGEFGRNLKFPKVPQPSGNRESQCQRRWQSPSVYVIVYVNARRISGYFRMLPDCPEKAKSPNSLRKTGFFAEKMVAGVGFEPTTFRL